MPAHPTPSQVAVIGTGMAGAHCAQALAAQGVAVQAVDKARGAGGRLATRRLGWRDSGGRERMARLDHGAPAFAAEHLAFRAFCLDAVRAGHLQAWTPTLAAGSRPLDGGEAPLFVAQPDMPSLCRALLREVPSTWSFAVERLLRLPQGWQLEAAGERLPTVFDAVVLAMPLPQAAPLLAPHRSDWAQRASLALMQPGWTLMGVSRCPADLPRWDLARVPDGPLASVMRHEGRPGRDHEPGEVHWVVHARPAWSRQHLERSPEWVQAQLQDALHAWLGAPLDWQHAVVHRWRYAAPQHATGATSPRCWWDAGQRLGVCGDAFGRSGHGVEDAWCSAQALVEAMGLAGGHALPVAAPSPSIHAA